MFHQKTGRKPFTHSHKGVRLLALALAAALVLALCGCASQMQDPTQAVQAAKTPKSTKSPDKAPETEAPETEEPETEEPDEPAPITAVDIVDRTSAMIVFWEELQARRSSIEAYPGEYQVAIYDVYGNELPELFCFEQNPAEPYYYDLNIYTYTAGSLELLLSYPKVWGEVQITDEIAIFGGEAMAVYYVNCSESQITRSVVQFSDWNDPELYAEKVEFFDGPEPTGEEEFTAYGMPSDEEGYEQACSDALWGCDWPIITATGGYNAPPAVAAALELEPVGGTFEDMIAYVESEISGN